jgi:predicted cytidylate kinase
VQSSNRPKELGILVVIGGPGGSGSTTISKILARKWMLNRIYGGGLVRKLSKGKDLEDFVDDEIKDNPEVDETVDKTLTKMSYQKDILIESKVFAALATIRHIPTTLKIWLHADPETSVKRIFSREKWNPDQAKFQKELDDLRERRENDRNRFKTLYNVDISQPEKYNDIVIDSSKLDIHNTIKFIFDKIKQDKDLQEKFPPDYLKF